MNESNNYSFSDKDDLEYETKYPMPSNEEQAKMVLSAIHENNSIEIAKQVKSMQKRINL